MGRQPIASACQKMFKEEQVSQPYQSHDEDIRDSDVVSRVSLRKPHSIVLVSRFPGIVDVICGGRC